MKEVIYSMLYKLTKSILYIIDFIVTIFYRLSGVESIEGIEHGDILSHLIRQNVLSNSFLIIALIGILVLGVVTILAILKAQTKQDISNSVALERSLKAFIGIWLIPFFVIAVVLGLNVVFRAIHLAMHSGGMATFETKIGAQLLVIAGKDAYIGEEAARQGIEAGILNGTLSYMDVSTISTYYNIHEINYLVAILGGSILLFLFCLSCIGLVQRIFEIVFLYLISPLAASTMPLDEGIRFARWRELVISKIVASYSIVLSMNVYLMVLPFATSIRYLDNNIQNSLVHLLIVIAGAFSVVKTSSLISNIIGSTGSSLSGYLSEVRLATGAARGAGITLMQTSKQVTNVTKSVGLSMQNRSMQKEVSFQNNNKSTLKNLYD